MAGILKCLVLATLWWPVFSQDVPPEEAAADNTAEDDGVEEEKPPPANDLTPRESGPAEGGCGPKSATPPTEYDTLNAIYKDGVTSDQEKHWTRVNAYETDGDKTHFETWVYYEVPEGAYDKRVIMTSYIQGFPEGCDIHINCDGQDGGNEFDMVETGFTGFPNTQPVDNPVQCEKDCGGKICTDAAGNSGCTWDTAAVPAYCNVGDRGLCNHLSDCNAAEQNPSCVWNGVEASIDYCTQVSEYDPTNQDFTTFIANAFFQGKNGNETFECTATSGADCNVCYDGNMQERHTHMIVDAGDENWGNRWIKLEADFIGDTVTYTYHFYQPGDVGNTDVTKSSDSSLTLTHRSSAQLINESQEHYWVYSLWELDYWGSVANRSIPDGEFKLHFRASPCVGYTTTTPTPESTATPSGSTSPSGSMPDDVDMATELGEERVDADIGLLSEYSAQTEAGGYGWQASTLGAALVFFASLTLLAWKNAQSETTSAIPLMEVE